jgi:hypothetical protein
MWRVISRIAAEPQTCSALKTSTFSDAHGCFPHPDSVEIRNTTMFYAPPQAVDFAGRTGGPSPSDVRNALDHILKSRTMAPSKRMIQFLVFVVETTLQGQAHDLKETTIGVAVFGRQPDYDPKVDAVVRNQAWRLRSKLKEYYETEGRADPLQILIPKGQYAPIFIEPDGNRDQHRDSASEPHPPISK